MASADLVAPLECLTDTALLAELRRLAASERRATVEVVRALAEVDERRLYLAEGCSSLFTYCTQVLRFSEHAAYGRIEAARAAKRFPAILDRLADGSLTLTAVNLLSAHLTPENHALTLDAARHKSKREIEQIVAAIKPQPPAPTLVRRVIVTTPDMAGAVRSPPSTSGGAVSVRPPEQPAPVRKHGVIAPLSPESYKVQMTISRRAHDHLRRAQELLRHSIPNGDAALVIERALSMLVDHLERTRTAAVRRARPLTHHTVAHSRHVPAAVKREVWSRDGGQCAFVGTRGRCSERGFLELHHVVPFADGGATDAQNLQLRCRAHNAYEAEQWSGPLSIPWCT